MPRQRDFFEAGGHSLLAAQAMARLGRELDRALPMSLLFEQPNIAGLAAHIASLEAPAPARIARRPQRGAAPLSRMQERVWFRETLSPGTPFFNVTAFWELHGPLDVEVLQRALDAFVQRQESTRTVLRWQGAEAVQEVRDDLAFPLAPVDLRGVPAGRRRAELERRLHEEANRPFDLAAGPLFRVGLYRTGDASHVLWVVAHHAIWDGWSSDLLLEQLGALYAAFRAGRPSPLEPLPIAYGDFAAWHSEWLRSEELARQRRYWLERLAGELPVLDLEPERPRPTPMSHAGRTLLFSLDAELLASLRELARRHDATLYMLLLTAYQCVLHSFTGHTDVLVGSPIRGRSWTETEELVGFFVNAQVLRTRLDPRASIAALLAEVRRTCLGAFANQDMPFDELVHALRVPRDPGRTPVYQAFFTFQDVRNRGTRFADLDCEEIDVSPDITPTELSLWLRERRDDAVGGLEYATGLYREETARDLVDRYCRALRQIARAPETALAELAQALRQAGRESDGAEPALRPSLRHRMRRLLGLDRPAPDEALELCG